MSKRTEFCDMDDHAVVIESRADRKAWAIKFTGVTYREFDKDDAPALALAILEASGVQLCRDPKAMAPTLSSIACDLEEFVVQLEMDAKEAADRAVLVGVARKIYNADRSACDMTWSDLSDKGKERWLTAARIARDELAKS